MQKKVLCQNIFWSCDGTSFVSVHNDFGIRQYLVPEEIDTDKTEKSLLLPFSRVFKNQSIVSCAVDPFYSLYGDAIGGVATDKIVIGSKNFPLQLFSITNGQCVASYDTANETNGEYEAAYSVKIDAEAHIYTGSLRNKVAVYDMNRREAMWIHRSTKKASKGRQSIISCFEERPAGGADLQMGSLLCGSYANEMFQVDPRHRRLVRMNDASTAARGIIQILTSDNGRYHYVARRNSDMISVYDRRDVKREVNFLTLPFRIRHDSAKFKLCIDVTHGLSMGTPWGTVLNWGRDLVEFGGVFSHQCTEEQTSAPTPFESEWRIGPGSNVSAMTIVENCPGDPGLLALAQGGTVSLGRLGG
ncbi:YNL187W [Saccharomyces arboricola H-6]|uniref:Protein SWT21 n=1 Tax=Saccharomyces arboricola (strain H-6 / AS 2.3317 / CBS 10644) TaxID=1160507 RepID=J8Q2X9_SACAR|nr:YNL187W [Saccharomyces arboricola H-6]